MLESKSEQFASLFRLVKIEVGTSALLTTLVRTDSRKFTMLFRLVRIEVGTILFRLVTTEVRTIATTHGTRENGWQEIHNLL